MGLPEAGQELKKSAGATSSKDTKLTRAPQKAIPSGFRMKRGVKEQHGKPIYCLAWSTDKYHKSWTPASRKEQSVDKKCDESMLSEASGSTSNDVSECVEEGSTSTGETLCSVVRCLATCGGNQVTVYEVDVPENGAFKSSEGLTARQAYVDTDESESFYTCAYGGRCVGTSFGYGPLQPNKDKATNRTLLPPVASFFSTLLKKRPGSEMEENGAQSADIESLRRQMFLEMTNVKSFDGPQLLCVAGSRGVIKVIDTVRQMLFATLSGHGDEIYDMKFSPTNEWLLLSASKDESLRLWNVQTTVCVAIFAGHEGHREQVLSLGWHPSGKKFVSAGMDSTVKLWSIEDEEVSHAIEQSNKVQIRRKDPSLELPSEQQGSFRTVYSQMPYFSSYKVHTDYIDCVQFVGDLVLSKSVSNTILLWKPDLSKSSHRGSFSSQQRLPNNFVTLREFALSNCHVWFIRFQTDLYCRMLAIGNNVGEIRLWDFGSRHDKKHFCTLTHQHCNSAVRMVAISPDGRCMVASCEDATLWQWDAV